MKNKILLSGVAGGIVIFVWSFISHMLLPLGEAGIKTLPNENAIIDAMRDNIKESSIYLFPSFMGSDMTAAQQEAYNKKREQGPVGFLVYHSEGAALTFPKRLVIELITNIISALIAAFLLSQALRTLTNFGSRVLFVTLLGAIPFFVIDASYWNWYDFPMAYVLAQLADQVVGFALAGVVMAKMLKQ
jgi:hypothetical protein